MTDPAPAGGYVPAESFESGRVTAVSADESRVVLGTAAGNVEIVATDDRTTVEFDAPIIDLAVGNRVYALADDTISALSAGGTRVWSVELPAARKLAALPGPDVLGVVTDDALLGFDGETGGQEFEAERPYADVTDDPGFFGTDGAFVLVAWSFLAVRNLDGTERFDLNLDGAIESAGIVDDTVVVSLKDERVVGVHATTGERQWERELSVTDLPDRGEDALLFTADDQLVSLTADGTYATVDELPSGDAYPASDGTLFCTITGDTIGVYCASGDPAEALSVSVAEDELVPGTTESIDLTVRNESDQPVAAALRVDGEGVTLRDTDYAVKLAAEESSSRTLPVEEIAAEDAAAITVEADGDHFASVSLPIEDRSDGPLVAEAELDAVRDGVATFAVEVRNEGERPVTAVSVSPGDANYGRLAPGESATAAVDTRFDSGTAVPISVRADDAETELDATVPREGYDVSVEEASDGFVDVRVRNRTDARLADDLVVAGSAVDGSLERRVEVPENGTFVLALRHDAGSVEAALDGLGVGESAQFGLEALDATGRRNRTDKRRGDYNDSKETSSKSIDGSGTPESDPAGHESESTEPRSSERPTTTAASQAASGDDDRTGGATGTAETSSADGPDSGLSAERTVETDEPSRTRAVRERLLVANEAEETAEDVTVDLPGETVSVGDVHPGDSVTVERRHAFTETGPVTLPAVAVTAANAPTTRIAERTLTVTPASFAVDLELEPEGDGYRIRAALTNRRDVACAVDRVGVRGVDVWNAEELRVPPGQRVEWTRRVDAPERSAGTVEAAVEYAFADGEPNRWLTLGQSPADLAADSESVAALTATIGDETRISGGYGSVVLVVENQSESPVADVSVEATGEEVSDLMYGGLESVEELAPGDRFTHFVDVETDGPDATISAVLSAGEDTAELALAGPAPADEDDWSADALDAWSVEWEDADGSDGADHVSTEFERT